MRRTISISEIARAAREWTARVADSLLAVLPIQLNPVPASRPRVSRWGTYYGKNYAAWRKEAEGKLERVIKTTAPYEGPVLVFMENIVAKPKTSKLTYPKGDVDNYAKGPLDLITAAERVWKDDDQVVGLIAFKRFADAGEQPRTDIEVHKLKLEE